MEQWEQKAEMKSRDGGKSEQRDLDSFEAGSQPRIWLSPPRMAVPALLDPNSALNHDLSDLPPADRSSSECPAKPGLWGSVQKSLDPREFYL